MIGRAMKDNSTCNFSFPFLTWMLLANHSSEHEGKRKSEHQALPASQSKETIVNELYVNGMFRLHYFIYFDNRK